MLKSALLEKGKEQLAMREQTSNAIVVLITAGSREEAALLAETLVNSRLAACVQILPERGVRKIV